ncbi:hypothetical protein RUM43_004679 [Polyplax serrata]|uniref:Uncharacterized protein n=1 Tax=Polyplax serrata TaxID=468196 RepID=A0AAN8SBY0_POLSC
MAYPGRDNVLREKIRQMWNKYYTCLEMTQNLVLKPEIHRLVEGQLIELYCPICVKPFQDYQELQWKYKALTPELSLAEPEPLDLTPQMELTDNMTLKIFNVVQDISGLYICNQGQSIISVYILEVSKNDVIEKVEISNRRKTDIINFEGVNFQVYYKWTPWTECSLCGNVGRKYKYGTCFIQNEAHKEENIHSNETSLNDGHIRIRKESINTTGTQKLIKISINNQSPDNNDKVKWLSQVIENTKNGVPCFWSRLTHIGFYLNKPMPAVKAMVRHCLVDCPETIIFQVLDNEGNVIEEANNSAGIYSTYQKIPRLPPDIERASVTANFGAGVTIQCPRSRTSVQ